MQRLVLRVKLKSLSGIKICLVVIGLALLYSNMLSLRGARAEGTDMDFHDEIETGTLCRNGDIKIYAPIPKLGAKEVKDDDDDACKWTFAAVNKDDFVLSNFGVYLIKDKLKETDRQRFAEFILKEYSLSPDFYVKFEERTVRRAFENFKFEIGITGGDESQRSVSNASFADSQLGTLFLFSSVPQISRTEGPVKLSDGRIIIITSADSYIYNYVQFWHERNIDILSHQLN